MNNIPDPPKKPESPPCRTFKDCGWCMIETNESKQKTKEWRDNLRKNKNGKG